MSNRAWAVAIAMSVVLVAFLVPFVPPPPCPANASCAAPPRLRSLTFVTIGVGAWVDQFGGYAITGLPLPIIIGTTTTQNLPSGTSTATGAWCVEAGEPLYPAESRFPLSNFTAAWGNQYQIRVFYSNDTVTVSGADHVGSSSLRTVIFPLVRC